MNKTNNVVSIENTDEISVKSIEDVLGRNITLGELAEGFTDNSEEEGGVFAWNDKLDIHPKFQRSYVVNDKKGWQTQLINSVVNNRPIGLFYLGIDNNNNTKYLVIDGQQRLRTLLAFIKGEITIKVIIDGKIKSLEFNRLPYNMKTRIKSYVPMIKVCEGNSDSLLKWFRTINQKNEILTDQELRNCAFAYYEFTECAKKAFSLPKARASKINTPYLKEGDKYYYGRFSPKLKPERQDVLELALQWVSDYIFGVDKIEDIDKIESYMDMHKEDGNAECLIKHYKDVIDWAYYIYGENLLNLRCAKNQNWGRIYALYHKNCIDRDVVRAEISRLVSNSEITMRNRIFEYVLLSDEDKIKNEGWIQPRAFSKEEIEKMFMMQGGIDPIDGKKYDNPTEMEAHHIVAWNDNGKTEISNGVMISTKNHDRVHNGLMSPEELITLRNEMFPKFREL